jgi:hypothetical protein
MMLRIESRIDSIIDSRCYEISLLDVIKISLLDAMRLDSMRLDVIKIVY